MLELSSSIEIFYLVQNSCLLFFAVNTLNDIPTRIGISPDIMKPGGVGNQALTLNITNMEMGNIMMKKNTEE